MRDNVLLHVMHCSRWMWFGSMHGVPERRSNERGGGGGVTSCVVPPPHSLPTERATLTPKYDRLLAARGCQ